MKVQLDEYHEKMRLVADTKRLKDEKALPQSKVSDIVNNPDQLEFLKAGTIYLNFAFNIYRK